MASGEVPRGRDSTTQMRKDATKKSTTIVTQTWGGGESMGEIPCGYDGGEDELLDEPPLPPGSDRGSGGAGWIRGEGGRFDSCVSG